MAQNSKSLKIILSPIKKVYNAFIDRNSLELWLAPIGMKGKIHDFDLRVGGGYQMSLIYEEKGFEGKTSESEDRFTAKFVVLQPYEKIFHIINFHSENPDFLGDMVMKVFLEEVSKNVTKVIIEFQDIPPGISPLENEKGTDQSLNKLAQYLET